MRILSLSTLLIAVCLLAGCSQAPPAPTSSGSPAAATATPPAEVGFVVKAKGADVPFEVKKAMVDVRPDVKEAHFSIANHEFVMKHMGANSVERPKEDGKVRISFGLKGAGEEWKNPVVAGEYTGDKLIWMDIYSGKAGAEDILNVENAKGGVTIESVSDTELKGKIDLTADSDVVVKGEFTAQRVPTE